MCIVPENGERVEPFSANKEKPKAVPSGWGTRHTFTVFVCLGFAISYALRFNLSIAIVSMVKPKSNSVSSLVANASSNNTVCPVAEDQDPFNYRISKMSKFSSIHVLKNESLEEIGANHELQFAWTEEQQGMILGSFFWGYVVTMYLGGKLSDRYGPKWVFSLGILITGILSLLTPSVTENYEETGIIVIRFLQGLAEGVTLPSIMVMVATWAPPEERGRMTNWVYAGIPIGTAVTMITGGYVVRYLGWPSLFYICGIVTILWFVVWAFLVYTSPADHPKISEEELKYIQSHLKDCKPENHVTPWKSIMTSMPAWAVLVADLGDSWAYYLLHVEVPIYLSSVHGFDIETNGWLSAMPQTINCIIALIMGHLTDHFISRKYAKVITVRKACSTIALWGSALGFVGMVLGGCNSFIAVVALNFGAGAQGVSCSGWVVNHIEIAPNHVGTISGFSNSIGNLLGFVAPYVTGLILQANPTLSGWRTALIIPAVISFSVNIFYCIFASAEVQPWNNNRSEPDENKESKINELRDPQC